MLVIELHNDNTVVVIVHGHVKDRVSLTVDANGEAAVLGGFKVAMPMPSMLVVVVQFVINIIEKDDKSVVPIPDDNGFVSFIEAV